ncbi:DUF791 domain-containing protein [Reticulomyxa filosa]|uniref:Molybdate-anion transporter n=1 Tax=Reticulomyxa filosa TaxID=46433 RepID=X6NFD2_RETFI|nr:DUF791 domain-containing protein [Reticulomyxa filosa]|eukprot:ETO24696.1 DUF791 domain-containing protein [Reticulomyxa filosa]
MFSQKNKMKIFLKIGITTFYTVAMYSYLNIGQSEKVQSETTLFASPCVIAAFDCALVMLVVSLALILSRWKENYGDPNQNVLHNIVTAFHLLMTDSNVFYLAVFQSTFESCMYLFVFMWTPILEESALNMMSGEIPKSVDHGMVFADFMLCCMLGTNVKNWYIKQMKQKTDVENEEKNECDESATLYVKFASYVCLLACVALGTISVCNSFQARLCCCLLFECCVGMYWPIVSHLRATFIPDHIRATSMNLSRIPLNVIVIVVLIFVHQLTSFPTVYTFWFCVGLLILSYFSVLMLGRR